ncbi:FH1/FH2 domain-containing protein 1 isoform X2 [Hypomesus transpacificus]|uniref:FH1/FH2 domain-containing protein 1 isoform X2 n=1 Tax=Hypomesus transpacificus TaxID=137520 RepID=UPI001F073064|nr:FH1/FH2 domain-containing protein 1 isoform X2 [Hypomesus transpacificus]
MKQSDQIKDTPLPSVFDQSWASFLNPAGRLRLNTLDFSDLWDEEDLGLDSTEEDGGPAQTPPLPPIPPPLPPSAPPLSRYSPTDRPPGSRTLRLHWRELQSLPPLPRVTRFGTQTIWAGLEPVNLDTNRLEYLFESKRNSAICSLLSGWRKQPSVSVLGVKRSNIITIALSSLPPPCLLPPAIYSMDTSVLDREDVQRLQALVPTEEELGLIREAQARAPRSTLAPAELCLLTLGSISHLSSRLQLWAFTLDYDILEREIAEPLFHLKLAMEQLAASQTFRCILATVLAVGNFLNGCKARGFELSYLGKLSQVRDTHSRLPLLHHVGVLLLQLYPQSSDLHSDIAAVARASKCDYTQVQANLTQLEALCKGSWEQVRLLDRADEKRRGGEKEGGGTQEGKLRQRLPKFLKECEERLKVLRAVHRRVINRFHSFMLFLGYSKAMVRETKAEDFCKTVSDFSLEYRTTRLSILEQRERGWDLERGGRDLERGGSDLERGGSDLERRGRDRTPGTPGLHQKHPPTGQDHVPQSTLDEVLRTPESIFRLNLTLPRHRGKKIDIKSPFSRRPKW